jgi:hypothetical protein
VTRAILVDVGRTDPTNDYRVSMPPPCEGCGGYHGGVNASLECLRLHMRKAREASAKAEAELGPIRKLRAEVAKLKFPPRGGVRTDIGGGP